MKTNLPVSGQEKLLPAGSSLVSRTDTKGIITFVNDAFVAASGFTREELIGSNHNIVRHPDLPPSVFEGMWRTLKRGLPWRGVVKNRCRNGDHYWVAAKVVPVRKNGETIGYMSVRSPAERDSIPLAEAAYQAAAKVDVFGEVGSGLWRRLLSVKNGVMFGIIFVTLLMLTGGILGITGLQLSNDAMRQLYHEEMAPVQAISRINFLMADNRAQVALAQHHNPGVHSLEEFDHLVNQHLDRIESNRLEIDRLWAEFAKLPRDATTQALAEAYLKARTRYVEEGLLPARQAVEKGDYVEAESLLLKAVTPLYQDASRTIDVLLTKLSADAERNFQEMTERNQNISMIAGIGLSVGLVLVVLSGFFFFRGTVSPLDDAVQALERIAEGNLSGDCHTDGFGEPGRVMNAVAIMQLHLKVMMDEIRQSSGSIHEQCRRLNLTMMNLSEHSEEQHDRVYQALDTINNSFDSLGRLASNAEQIADAVDALPVVAAASGVLVGEAIPAAPAAVEVAVSERLPGVLASVASEDPLLAEMALLDFGDDGGGAAGVDVGAPLVGESLPGSPSGAPREQLGPMARDLAVAARIEVFTMEESTAQINQVASLIVENRGEVQGAWAASQKLEQAALELDRLVKFFD